jgi:hypothetical protein
MGVVDTSTSRGRNFCIRSSFGALDTPLERSNEKKFLTGQGQVPLQSPWAPNPQKTSFRASKRPRKFGTRKTVEKLPRWKTIFRARGIGGWPPISTWINPPSLGRNGLHCIEFLGERGKRLLNLNLGELLALLETSCCLVCGRLS